MKGFLFYLNEDDFYGLTLILLPALDSPYKERPSSAIRQAGFKVAKSTSPCWLVNVIFLPLLLWCCCTPEMRWSPVSYTWTLPSPVSTARRCCSPKNA